MPSAEPAKKDPVDKTADPKKKSKKEKEQEEEMSEEDLALKTQLETQVQSVLEGAPGVQMLALEQIRAEIRTSTASMTSVPKPLKFLRPHYDGLKEFFTKCGAGDVRILLADVLSVLGMTMAKEGTRESLNFKLQGTKGGLDSWGHEYVRNLAGEIGHEWQERIGKEEPAPVEDLRGLVDEIVPFHVHHNAEPEACDLLIEVDLLPEIVKFVDEGNFSRIARYLEQCATYHPEPEDARIFRVVLDVFLTSRQWPDAVRIALRLGDMSAVGDLFRDCPDDVGKKQMAYTVARHGVCPFPDLEVLDDEVAEILANTKLTDYFKALGRDLDVWEAKTAEDIYKSHLENTRTTLGVDSARQNLATTFVNGFVNAGFGHDKLITPQDGHKWIYKNKDHGMLSAAASLGLIQMWDVDGGLSEIDKVLYATDDYIKAGGNLAVGIVNCNVRHSCDPALALLSEEVNAGVPNVRRMGAAMGLGLAYAGTAMEGTLELLTPIIADADVDIEIAETIMTQLLEREEKVLTDSMSRFACLGLGLLFLGRQEESDMTLEALKAVPGAIGSYCAMTVETCAYAGTGNVMKAQRFLQECADHLTEDNSHQAVAALGLALCAQGEPIGAEMAIRMLEHMLQYGEMNLRRVVPLCIGLLNISNPKPQVVDMLSRLTHDGDDDTAMGAILSLGLVAAGTNNARVAQLLRLLVQFYAKDANMLFTVRLAQALLHMGKGLVTLNPAHSDRLLMSNVGLGGLLVIMHACLDIKTILLGKHHYMMYFLAAAMSPRMLMTLDEEGNSVPVSVRVGQAVDTVGQAGRPKTITGFQTHTTPVLLMADQRAELATEEYVACSPVLEGFVIVKKNPDFVQS